MTDHKRSDRLLALVVVIVLGVATIVAASGTVKAQSDVEIDYQALFGTQWPATLGLRGIAEEIYYSDESIRWLWQGDSGPFVGRIEDGAYYSEATYDKIPTGVSSNSRIIHSGTFMKYFAQGAGDGDYLGCRTTFTPTQANGLIDSTEGVNVYTRIRVVGDPIFNLSYEDASGRIAGMGVNETNQFQYHRSSGGSTTTALLSSYAQSTWYILKMSIYPQTSTYSNFEFTIYDSGGRWASDYAGTTTLQIGDATIFYLEVFEESATRSYVDVDWVYVTSHADQPVLWGTDAREDNTDDEVSADDNEEIGVTDWSLLDLGITNDSGSAEAQDFWGHSRTFDSETGDYADVQAGDFLSAWSVTPELFEGGAQMFEQTLFTSWISNPRAAFEKNLQEALVRSKGLGFTPQIVDYNVNNVWGNVSLDPALLNQVENFWTEQAPGIIAQNGGIATFTDGTTLVKTGREVPIYNFNGEPLAQVSFPDQEAYKETLLAMTDQFRQNVMGGLFVLKGERTGFYDKEPGIAGGIPGLGYMGMTAPVDGSGLLASCSYWDIKCKAGNAGSSIKTVATSTAYNLGSTVYTGATEIAKSPVSYISNEQRDEYFEEWQGEQDSTDTVDEIVGSAETDLGGLPVLDTNLSKLTDDPVGVATFLPTYKVSTTTMLIAGVSVIAIAIVAIYFGATKRGRAAWQRIRAGSLG